VQVLEREDQQALAQEVAGFGIKVTLIEPGGYSTDWGGASPWHTTPLPAYDELRDRAERWRARRQVSRGDPVATRQAVRRTVDAEEPPLRVFFGDGPLELATADYEAWLATWRAWEPVSIAAHSLGE